MGDSNEDLDHVGTGPAEVAATVLFLVSDQSSGMTGSELLVDGGSSIA